MAVVEGVREVRSYSDESGNETPKKSECQPQLIRHSGIRNQDCHVGGWTRNTHVQDLGSMLPSTFYGWAFPHFRSPFLSPQAPFSSLINTISGSIQSSPTDGLLKAMCSQFQ